MAMRISLLLMLCAAFVARGDEAKLLVTRINENSFYVAGYSIRTNNADETAGRGKIGTLWQSFVQENLGATIPDRIDHDLIAVYSDYSVDENGDYTYLLGARVSCIDHLRAGMTFRRVIAAPYAVLTTRVGPLVAVLQAEWKKIWRATAAELGGQRAFVTDYEVYDRRSADPQLAQVEIHVGLKPDRN
jgi:predicted transcriptional regulator YdeE